MKKVISLFVVMIMLFTGWTGIGSFDGTLTVYGYSALEDEALTMPGEAASLSGGVAKPGARWYKEGEEVVIREFVSNIPEGVIENKKYDRYEVFHNYLLILWNSVNIREQASADSPIIGNVKLYDKINLLAEVKGQYIEKYATDSWYKVSWQSSDQTKVGYILSKLGEPREFQFEKMAASILSLKGVLESGRNAYITNYKNWSGTAPLYNGATEDAFGGKRHQAAPAYYKPSTNSDFRYISDGALITILGEEKGFYKISTINFEGEYYVQKRYVNFGNPIKSLEKVIVVDRKNQNEGVFEYIDGSWNIISYIYATTGELAKYKQPTDLGYYKVIEKRSKFVYLDDETGEVSGYAPFALRFSGGAYIHGVPVEYQKEGDKLIDPGIIEYLSTIGTTPRSHKCVRNFSSHAEFLYNWAELSKTAIIVIE